MQYSHQESVALTTSVALFHVPLHRHRVSHIDLYNMLSYEQKKPGIPLVRHLKSCIICKIVEKEVDKTVFIINFSTEYLTEAVCTHREYTQTHVARAWHFAVKQPFFVF